jgi:hypothetical protein
MSVNQDDNYVFQQDVWNIESLSWGPFFIKPDMFTQATLGLRTRSVLEVWWSTWFFLDKDTYIQFSQLVVKFYGNLFYGNRPD